MWFKQNLAALLTVSRILFGTAASVLFVLAAWWPGLLVWVIWCIALAVLSEPVDGRVARHFRAKVAYWPFSSPESMNNQATGVVLCGLLPGAVGLCLFINVLQERSFKPLLALIVWIVACGIFIGGTVFLAKAKEQLRGKAAERAEVVQGWFAGFIILSCAFVAGWLLWGWHATLQWDVIQNTLLYIAFICILGRDRLTKRDEERMHYAYTGGKKSWKQFFHRL